MPVQPLLARQMSQPRGLSQVAVVGFFNGDVQIEAAEPNETHDVIKTDRGPAGLPSRDGGLGSAGEGRQLRLGKPRAATCLPN